jgi:hypothetical protein
VNRLGQFDEAVSFGSAGGMGWHTLEVEIEHGRIKACGDALLPEHARGFLTLRTPDVVRLDPLKQDPELMKVEFVEDPTKPLDPEDWPEAFE